MYHNSVCCNSVRPVRPFRFQGYGDWWSPGRSIRLFQGNKCDSKSPCVGLHGLSFDPTDTHALLCAVNALQSTKDPQRCPPVRTSCSDSPRQSSSCSSSSKSCDTSDSLTAPSACAPLPCPSGPAQFTPITEPEQACSCSSHSTSSSSQENYSSQGMCQRGSKRGSVGVTVGAEISSKVLTCSEQVKTASGEESGQKKGLTWIDWGWPGTHDPCPFNQRHTVGDSLIRPEPVYCESSRPFIGKLVRCCKIRVRQLREVCWQEEIMATTAVDVKELAASYVFIADMPGLKHTDIKVQVENDNVLKISGERKREDAVQDGEVKYVRVERSAGKFMRKFNLPANANLDAISAACQDGLLTIIVPKTPPPDIYRPRTFDVNVISANLGH